jgi:dTDP-4-dehydrorhamnose reductase
MSYRRILIIGSDGKIGSKLLTSFGQRGASVIGSTRDFSKSTLPGKFYFELGQDISQIRISDIDYAVFCAGISSIQVCEANKEMSDLINITWTDETLRTLDSQGIKTIFLSTNHVFNSARAFPGVNDPVVPRNRYGEQKSSVERIILNELKNVSILRLTKIMDEESSIITSWETELGMGRQIRAFKDVMVSFVSMGDLINALEKIFDDSSEQLFQLGGTTEITYFDFCVNYFANHYPSRNLILGEYKNDQYLEHNSLETYLPL